MQNTLLAALVALSAFPLSAQAPEPQPELTSEQEASLRCGVAFGLIARDQAAGDAHAATYPAMEPRGREFFVRTMARLMDEKSLDREAANRLALRVTGDLMRDGAEARERMMPACLLLLDASGL